MSLILTTFNQAFWHAVTTPAIVGVVIAGFICGFCISAVHRFSATDIKPWLVGLLGGTLMVSLQVATDIAGLISDPARSDAIAGGHLGYLLLSIVCGLACWPGAWVAKRLPFRHHDIGPLPEFDPTVNQFVDKR